MILGGLDTCEANRMKSPFCDIKGKELALSDRVIVEFDKPIENGITEVRFAFDRLQYCMERNEWGLWGGVKLGMLASPLTQEYINEHKVKRDRIEDQRETYLRALKAAKGVK